MAGVLEDDLLEILVERRVTSEPAQDRLRQMDVTIDENRQRDAARTVDDLCVRGLDARLDLDDPPVAHQHIAARQRPEPVIERQHRGTADQDGATGSRGDLRLRLRLRRQLS